ncbi:MAG: RNA polymerase-associated protein RapA [Bacteroidia bacterium]|nr:RNA polymerase-associated protein RapA [Bacteroidia bacterium]
MAFYPGQRYTSEGEPELGVGIVIEAQFGRVKIHFQGAGETRLYAESSAPLKRLNIKPGDTIQDANQRSMLVERIQEGDLYLYIGTERVISEDELGDVRVQHSVDDRLFNGDVDNPEQFALRRRTLDLEHRRRLSPIQGFVGGRIDLIPHQLYIAHEVSSRFAPRILLSDEVGLGKTIEACLILHRLLLSGRISRVLILVPESLLHQWFVEMLRRFNLWFHILDEERCRELEEGAPEGNPFLDSQLVICHTDFLTSSPKRAQQALTANWDMLVVDEAHHLKWSEEDVSSSYKLVEHLSQAIEGLLLLTATPQQLGIESHFARLRLLDPDRYTDFSKFKAEPQDHQFTADLLENLSKGSKLNKAETQWLQTHFGSDRIEELKERETARDQLIEDILDQYGPGRVIFRNTRAAIEGFPKRVARLAPLRESEDSALWVARFSEEFVADISKESGLSPKFYFSKDPRLKWLRQLMDKLAPAKVLLICRSKEKVLSLEAELKKQSNLKLAVFHEDLSIVQRDRNAAWFAEPNGARLLLCSEIGSEGRNFQFSHQLVLFDLPLNPELLEQRIGRLDRIGQQKDIQIHIPYLIGSPQEVLVRWFHEGLQAFEQNLEGADQLSSRFGEELRSLFEDWGGENATARLEKLILETATFQQEIKKVMANGRNRLLEMNSYRPKVAAEIVNLIEAADRDMTLEQYMTEVFEQFAVEMEDLGPRSYFLHPAPQNLEAFPGVPQEGVAVSFSRKWALSREDASFLSWDHPIATGTLDMVLGSGLGSASFGVLRIPGKQGLLIEAIFVLESMGGEALQVDRFLPPTPIRVVVDHKGDEQSEDYPPELIDQRLIWAPMDELLENEVLMEAILPRMIADATELAELRAATHIMGGIRNMEQSLDHEIRRLEKLQEVNQNIRSNEIELARKSQQLLKDVIQDAGIRLDSLQLIRLEY